MYQGGRELIAENSEGSAVDFVKKATRAPVVVIMASVSIFASCVIALSSFASLAAVFLSTLTDMIIPQPYFKSRYINLIETMSNKIQICYWSRNTRTQIFSNFLQEFTNQYCLMQKSS